MSQNGPHNYELSHAELVPLDELLTELVESDYDPGTPDFQNQAWQFTPRLPLSLRVFLCWFKQNEPVAATTISGLPLDDELVGPTPAVWSSASAADRTRREEFFLAMIGNLFGDVFSWSTLQGGRMIQNVLPIRGEEAEQSGHGSTSSLEWHTEDGFHPYRCDYLLLFGVRNHAAVPTTLASVRDVTLSAPSRQILAERRFYILPDNEHLNQLVGQMPTHRGLAELRRMREHPEPVAVLYGNLEQPYLRIDPFFMRCAEGDTEAAAALEEIVHELNRIQTDVVVGAGTLLIVDNSLAVHGRRAFTARYDGADRWLKKTIVTRDLRKSRAVRSVAQARVLH